MVRGAGEGQTTARVMKLLGMLKTLTKALSNWSNYYQCHKTPLGNAQNAIESLVKWVKLLLWSKLHREPCQTGVTLYYQDRKTPAGNAQNAYETLVRNGNLSSAMLKVETHPLRPFSPPSPPPSPPSTFLLAPRTSDW